MNGTSLNLLRHPRRWPAIEARQLMPVFIAIAIGVLAGTAGVWMQNSYQAHWEARRMQLQQNLRAQQHQFEAQRSQKEQGRVQEQLEKRAAAWNKRREQLALINQVLSEQAARHGLRLQRWQSDARSMLLQCSLPSAELLPMLMSDLTRVWPKGWQLRTLADHGEAGVDAVLEAPVSGSNPEAR